MKDKAEACGLAFDQEYIRQTFAPNYLGALRDSKMGLYAPFRDAHRPIGAGRNANEAVHRSAVDRVQQARDPAYQPPELMRFLKAGGRVTA
jgi:hypothetical protein